MHPAKARYTSYQRRNNSNVTAVVGAVLLWNLRRQGQIPGLGQWSTVWIMSTSIVLLVGSCQAQQPLKILAGRGAGFSTATCHVLGDTEQDSAAACPLAVGEVLPILHKVQRPSEERLSFGGRRTKKVH